MLRASLLPAAMLFFSVASVLQPLGNVQAEELQPPATQADKPKDTPQSQTPETSDADPAVKTPVSLPLIKLKGRMTIGNRIVAIIEVAGQSVTCVAEKHSKEMTRSEVYFDDVNSRATTIELSITKFTGDKVTIRVRKTTSGNEGQEETSRELD